MAGRYGAVRSSERGAEGACGLAKASMYGTVRYSTAQKERHSQQYVLRLAHHTSRAGDALPPFSMSAPQCVVQPRRWGGGGVSQRSLKRAHGAAACSST